MKLPIASAVAVLTLGLSSPTLAQSSLDTEQQQLSYILGLDVGESLQNLEIDIDVDLLMTGIGHALSGEERLISADEADGIRNAFIQRMQAQAQQEAFAQAQALLEQGQQFMAENAQRDGVEVTDSGLQYEVLEAAEGDSPAATDVVTVHYQGTLIDGTEFDSSYSRGEPATFPLDGVIPGWTEGLQLMTVGSTYRFVIPPELAYGEQGAGQVIAPNSTLVFEVELLGIE